MNGDSLASGSGSRIQERRINADPCRSGSEKLLSLLIIANKKEAFSLTVLSQSINLQFYSHQVLKIEALKGVFYDELMKNKPIQLAKMSEGELTRL
jgi:hypothetical protein